MPFFDGIGLVTAWTSPSDLLLYGGCLLIPVALAAVGLLRHSLGRDAEIGQAALEVLALVAHRQPVTLPEINFIRGTNSSAVTRTLLERRLVRLAGRKKVVGKPFLYRTTKEFLLHFGLDRAEDLPDPEELVEAETASDA